MSNSRMTRLEWRNIKTISASVKNIFVLNTKGEIYPTTTVIGGGLSIDANANNLVAWCTRHDFTANEPPPTWRPVYPINYTRYLKKNESSFPLGTVVEVMLASGEIIEAHWAADLSGEEQPQYIGWFKKTGNGYSEIDTPLFWRQIQ